MATLLTALQATAPITTTAAPLMGYINRYNASSAALNVVLPALSGLTVGAVTVIEKDTLDGSFNPVTFAAAGSDTFDDGTTGAILVRSSEKRHLGVVSIGGVKYWKIIDGYIPRGSGVLATTSQFSLSNSTAVTTIVGATNQVSLIMGSTYRITICGSVQFAATSGTLTFTPLVVNTALAQTVQMPSQGSAGGPVNLDLHYLITVRTSGTSGTVISKPFGRIDTSTPIYLSSTSTSTTTVNTGSTTSPVVGLQAQWATANASNILLVEIATIERVT